MSKTQVYDRWHLSRPSREVRDAPSCEHSTKTKTLYAATGHGVGMRWQVRWRDHNGQQHKENYERKSDADKRANSIAADMDRGVYIDPQAAKESLASVAERWQAGVIHKDSTAEYVERIVRLHITPHLGNRSVAAINRSDVQSWVRDRSQVLAPGTLRNVYRYLKAILNVALMDGQIARNPAVGVKLPALPKNEVRVLHPDVVSALVAAAPERFSVMLLVAAATGLRQGELFGLEVEHVDLRNGEVHVRQQAVSPNKGAPYISTPKTHHSVRTVPLAPFAVDAIKAHLKMFPVVPVLMEDRTDPRKPVERKANLIFTRENGTPWRRGQWSHQWADIVKAANKWLEQMCSEHQVQVPEDATMHDLRDFYASLLIHHGESVKVVQRHMGHAKASVTLDTYAHLWEAAEDTSRDAVTQGIGSLRSALDVTPHLSVAA
ncbi:tyrosine-type recombinase/integrase [Streptomyces sp. O3]